MPKRLIPFGSYVVRHIGDTHGKALACPTEQCKREYVRMELQLFIGTGKITLSALCGECGKVYEFFETDTSIWPELRSSPQDNSEKSEPATERAF